MLFLAVGGNISKFQSNFKAQFQSENLKSVNQTKQQIILLRPNKTKDVTHRPDSILSMSQSCYHLFSGNLNKFNQVL